MPRQPRVDAPGALHYVIGRGVERTKISSNEIHRGDFIKRIEQICSSGSWIVYASATFAIIWVGRKHILIPTFDAAAVLQMIQTEKITPCNLIPTMLNMMVNTPDLDRFDYSSLRVILSGGVSIVPETVRKIIYPFPLPNSIRLNLRLNRF